MRIVLLICIVHVASCVSGQTGREGKIDSLENLLSQHIQDTTRAIALAELARTYGGVDSVKSFKNGFAAVKLSEEIGFLRGLAKSNIDLAGCYLDYFDIENAKTYYEKGVAFSEKLIAEDSSKANLTIWCRGAYNLGVVYGYEGNVEKEIELAAMTIPIAEKMGDKLFLANANTNLGIKHNNLQNYEEAYKLFMISQKQFDEIGVPEDFLYHSLAFSPCLYSLDSLSKMKKVLDRAKENLDKIPNSFYTPSYYSELGLYYGGVGEYEKSIATLNKAYSYYEPNSKSVYLKHLYQRFAAIYSKMGQHEKAKEYTLKFLNFTGHQHSFKDKASAYLQLATYEANLNNYETAYQNLKTYVLAQDSLRINKLGADMKNLEAQYKIATKETKILALQNEKNKAALSLEKKKSQAYLLRGIISVLALLLFSGYNFYKRKLVTANKKEQQRDIELQQLKQQQQNKIFSAMIEGQEKERKRLAIDLHDGLGGRLSGISMKLSKLDKDEPIEYPKKQLQVVMKDLNDSLSELRNVARNMMPETLIKFGLQAAINDYCSSMTDSDSKVTLQFYGTDLGIKMNQQVMMYRVIQELINNAIKHAKANEVLVQYIREGNQVDITVEDNGIGFDKNIILNQNNGMGLSNLQARVSYLKGQINFESVENEGTTVNVHFQIDEE